MTGRECDVRGELVCTVLPAPDTLDPPVPGLVVVRVRGILTVATVPVLRAAVLKCLAETPEAVILDVAELLVVDDLAITVFLVLARHAAAWPAIPLLLCSPQPALAEALARYALDRQVPVHPGLGAAVRAVQGPHDLRWQLRDCFPPVVASVAAARRLVVVGCGRWRLPHLADLAGLVVTELVANAVNHARTSLEVIVTRGTPYLHLAVRDYGASLPRIVGPDEDGPGGRGLLIVDGVANHWGCTPTADGKVTWASLRVTGGWRR